MMKRYSIFALASGIALSLFASCSKDNHVPAPAAEKITITASFPEEGLTKVGFVEDGYNNKLNLVWQAGDQITITDEADPSNTQTFDIVSGMGTKSATFSGTAPAAAASYKIIYNGNPSYAVQTQAADGDTGHLKYEAMLTGVTDYSSFTFTAAASSAVLRLRTQIPAGFYGNVKSVVIKAGTAFVKVNIADSADAGETNVFTVYASLPGEMAIAAGTELYVSFMMDETKAYLKHTAYRVLPAMTIEAGKVNTINLNCSAIETSAGAVDNGTAAKPYLIADQYQMKAMHNVMADNATKYFKMVEDVDMKGVAWTSLNNAGSFGKGIDFDGDGHVIDNLTCKSDAYPSFVGVINGTVKNIVFDHATITAGSNTAGVLAGYCGSGSTITGNFSGITVKNSSVTGSKQRLGGIVGRVVKTSVSITDCHVENTSVTSSADRVGGLLGEFDAKTTVSGCTATNVTVEGSIHIGGLIGVLYGEANNCASSGTVTSTTNGKTDVGLGGFAGYVDNASAFISQCSTSVTVNQPENGLSIGGFVGYLLRGTVEKCFSTGNVSGKYRYNGGFVGKINAGTGTATISDCYTSGNVSANSYSGGFIGGVDGGTVNISRCYSSGSVTGTGFALGGLAGYVGVESLSMQNCAAWNPVVTPTTYGANNWSSGAVVGVTFPTCTLTDNYRSPAMVLTAYWVPAADYSHPDVSTAHPLVMQNGAETTATALASGQQGYPQFPYHGKVEAGKTLSQLASTTLGWDSAIWDFSAVLPTLK